MHERKILSAGYWQKVKELCGKERKRCAIAFVTRDLIGLGEGDTLVVNASKRAIRGGQTSAKLLLELHDRGVEIYDSPNLHAKVLELGNYAVVGSGNMSDKSNSPESGWLEAAVATNDPILLAGVSSLIEQLTRRRGAHLDRDEIEALTKIKVERRGGWGAGKKGQKISELGNRLWIAGAREIEATADEDAEADKVNRKFGRELNWLRYSGSSRLVKDARAGDSAIILWRETAKSSVVVYRSTPILHRRKEGNRVYLYHRERQGCHATMTFARFKKLLKDVGYGRGVKPGSAQLVSTESADAILQHWSKAAAAK